MDDEDYEDILEGKLRVDDGEGFDIEYQDWDIPFGSSDIGTSQILELSGDDWVRKYSRANNGAFASVNRSGNLGLTLFGIIGMINIILATVSWFLFLGKEYPCGTTGDGNSDLCL